MNGTLMWASAFGTLLSLMVCLSARSTAFSQAGEQAPRTETVAPNAALAVGVDQGPKMDGTLDDRCGSWRKRFRTPQQEPYEGQPATERTEVRIYTQDMRSISEFTVSILILLESSPANYAAT